MDVAGIRETFIVMSALMSLCGEKEFGLNWMGARKRAGKLILKWLYEYRRVNILRLGSKNYLCAYVSGYYFCSFYFPGIFISNMCRVCFCLFISVSRVSHFSNDTIQAGGNEYMSSVYVIFRDG